MNLKEKMAEGNVNRCVTEFRDVVNYLSQQIKDKELPSEEEISQYMDMLEEIMGRLDVNVKILREAQAREAVKTETDLFAEQSNQKPLDKRFFVV